jgi:serine/threonine protein kinase
MTPASQLKGLKLDGGWTVVNPAARKPNATGGFFSVGYIVQHDDGRKGFLKALDYVKVMQHVNAPHLMQAMTAAYLFEVGLCQKVAHLSKVARAVGSGSLLLNPADAFTRVEYLIFELADEDIRQNLDAMAKLDLVFLMRTLHDVATGLAQLHQAQIAHQDLKPSNVLFYKQEETSKICDLGRAWDMNATAPHDKESIAGDRQYAPIEQLYGEISADHRVRRFGCDMYHLGSLTVFLFARTHMSALLIDNLDPQHRPASWGSAYRDVLPFVQAAFDISLEEFARSVPDPVRNDLRTAVSQLCDPDPARRGHPLNRNTWQFNFARYISLFDLLGRRAECGLFKKIA